MNRLHAACAVLALLAGSLAAGEAPRVLILLAPGFNNGEHHQLAQPLRAHGYAVDVAAERAGTVALDRDGKPDARGRDATAVLALADVGDAGRWVGLAIPGGYSPGRLERLPDAIRICRAFAEAGKPIAAVCHGPRLLARAGLLRGRAATYLHTVVDEIPDAWRAGELGTYADLPVVRDGGVLTARYPNDVPGLARACIAAFAEVGGLPAAMPPARAVLIAADPPTPHAAWALVDAPRVVGVEVILIAKPDAGVAAPAGAPILVWPGAASAALAAQPGIAAMIAAAGGARTLPEGAWEEQLPRIAAAARAAAPPPPPAAPIPPATAAIAVEGGFDDAAVLAAIAWCRSRGAAPAVIAHARGWVRGAAGAAVEATATYAEPPELAPGAVVIAPGGLWPGRSEEAHQVEEAPWVAAQIERDRIRTGWLLDAHRGGARLLAVGFDALRLARTRAWPKAAFAGPESTLWSFKPHAATYSAEPLAATAERLWTARDAAAALAALAGPAAP